MFAFVRFILFFFHMQPLRHGLPRPMETGKLTMGAGRAHYVIVSKVQWKPFWLATLSTE